MFLAFLLGLFAWAGRPPLPRPEAVYWEEGRDPRVAIVKFRDDASIYAEEGKVHGVDAALREILGEVQLLPKFASGIRRDGPIDLRTYVRLESPAAEVLATELLADPRVESAWLAPLPPPPPEDIPPVTPDFVAEMAWLGPVGPDFVEAARWPGGRGAYVTVADIEYAFTADHEDLAGRVPPAVWGWESGDYAFHGTMVLGMLTAGNNGYGMTGAVDESEVLVLSPYDARRWYDVAAAVLAAVELLVPGDVLLIEQQGFRNGTYCPASIEPDVFDAIAAATAAGIVVIEPSGNGEADLDDRVWNGWFDREIQDSGSVMVGGGVPPGDLTEPARSWGGSSYGGRIDVQGWYGEVATLTDGEQGGYYADLFFPDGDGRQGYTSFFSGTSSASAMVAAAAAVAQSVHVATTGAPMSPSELRALLVSTGSPQTGASSAAIATHRIGPQPDLRRLLRSRIR